LIIQGGTQRSIAPTPETTAVIITGASAWPQLELEARDAYANSAVKLEAYLTVNFRLPRRNLLLRFDSDLDASDMIAEIGQFIKERRDAQITDLVFCHIGHGDFIGDDEFYMPIRSTKKGGGLERSTALVGRTLADTFKEHARFLNLFMMLDCCYAAAAADLFGNAVGVTALCSSGSDIASTLLPDGSQTMFSAAVVGALESGRVDGTELLSLAQVRDLAVETIRSRWPDTPILPELHSPVQKKGDLSDLPFFPNPAHPSMRLGGLRSTSPVRIPTVKSESDRASAELSPIEARRRVAAALEPMLQAAFAQGAQLPGEGLLTFAIRQHDRAAAPNGSEPGYIEITVLVFNREDLLRATGRLLQLTDGDETFNAPQFIRAGLREASMRGDRASLSGADLGARFEQVIRTATSDLSGRTPGTVSVRRSKQGEWPEVRLDLELAAPKLNVPGSVVVHIEIRSMLDDMLSEIHHEIRLLLTQDRAGQKDRLLRQAESHIGVLQKMFDGCLAYVDAIRRDMNEGVGGSLGRGKPLASMSKPDQVRAFLINAAVPQHLIDEAIAVIAKVRDHPGAPTETQVQELLTDAGTLRSLVERESQPNGYLVGDGPGQRAFKYIARMDEALLLIQTNRPEHLSAAIEIYKDLEILFPLSPTVRFRLAWALGKLERRPEALEYYNAANALIEEALALGQFERDQRVMMHEIDYMRESLSRLIGFQYWAISQDCANRNDRAGQITNLLQAYRTTEAGLSRSGDEKKTHNNLLYYATEYLMLMQNGAAPIDPSTVEFTINDVTRHLDYLEPQTDLDTETNETFVDTLRFCYVLLGRPDDAVRAAKRVQYLFLGSQQPRGGLDERGRRLLSAAYRTLQEQGNDKRQGTS
jgi:hypothetical protein